MPFVTAKIYSYLVNYDNKDIMVSEWPKVSNEDYSNEMDFIENLKNRIDIEDEDVAARLDVCHSIM